MPRNVVARFHGTRSSTGRGAAILASGALEPLPGENGPAGAADSSLVGRVGLILIVVALVALSSASAGNSKRSLTAPARATLIGASLPSINGTAGALTSDSVVNVLAYGATDAAIRLALGAARALGEPLYFPAGTYTYDNVIDLRGVSAYGDGPVSILVATNPARSAVKLTGSGQYLRDLEITSPLATARDSSSSAAGVNVYNATNFLVQRVTVAAAAETGIFTTGSSDGRIESNVIIGTLADGIHTTGRSSNIVVADNSVSSVGDDMIAVVSYLADGAPCHDIQITGNDVHDQTHGRGISVVGGDNVTVQSNKIARSAGAGVLVNSDGSYGTYGTTGVQVLDNMIDDPSTAIDHGGVHVQGGSGEQVVSGTLVQGNTITHANRHGIVVSSLTTGTVVQNNTITTTGADGIQADAGRDITISSNTITDASTNGISVLDAVTGTLTISDNILRDVNRAALSYIDVIFIEPRSALSSGAVTDNSYTGRTYDRLVENTNSQITVSGNTGYADHDSS
jgi:parallel beta-helix repeat protein